MRIPQDVVNQNRIVSGKLREVFTPLCETLLKRVNKITPEMIQTTVNDITLAMVNYQASKFDTSRQLPPSIENSHVGQLVSPSLSENEVLYFNSFLYHLNETAVLKPYNFAELLTGRFQEYLWAPQYSNQKDANNHAADTSVIPIGEYGIDPSLLMLLTTTLLLREVDKMQTEGLEAEKAHWDLLSVETLRGRRKAENSTYADKNVSVLDTFREGIQSYQATVSSLTSKKISDMDFICILEQITKDNLAQRIAVRVPFSYTLPSIRQGIYFENIFNLHTGAMEKLHFSNAFMEYCKATQDLYKQSRLVVDGKRNPGLLGTGCPISQKQCDYDLIGINYVGKAYLQLFKLVQSTVDLRLLKTHICQLKLSPATDVPVKATAPDEFKTYNVDRVSHSVSKAIVSEMIELQQMSNEVLAFWFNKLPIQEIPGSEVRDRWFNADPDFDKQIRERFLKYIDAMLQGKYMHCKRTTSQTLAMIIVLDQFSRNIHRGSPGAFQCDQLAASLAMDVIKSGQDQDLPLVARWFLYMPLQHAENLGMQEKSVDIFKQLRQEAKEYEEQVVFNDVVRNAVEHRDIIRHFGRFPHRNKILDRVNTHEETAYLSTLTAGSYYNASFFTKQMTSQTGDIQTPIDVQTLKCAITKNSCITSALLLLSMAIYATTIEDVSKFKATSLLLLLFVAYNFSSKISSVYQAGLGFLKPVESKKNNDDVFDKPSSQCPFRLNK